MNTLVDLLRNGPLIIETFGYAGILLIALVEGSGLPLPFPGTLVLAFVGYTVWSGSLGFIEAIVAAAAGSTAGGWLLYRVARDAGPMLLARYGHRLALTADKISRAESWFDVHAGRATFFARVTPGVRIYISVAAGLARMNQALFIMATFAGTCLWSGFFIAGGWALGRGWRNLSDALAGAQLPLMLVVAAIIVVALAVRLSREEHPKS